MKMRANILAAAISATAVIAAASPAKAIDIHNCTQSNLKILFYNASDLIELISKKRIDVAAGGAVTKVRVPGRGTHKIRIFDKSHGNRALARFKAIYGDFSYVLFFDPNGKLAMVTGNGC